MCVGMTGSGKTGLCLSLLEEANVDGIPAGAVDPKGDLGNLFLTFPELKPEEFKPWVDPAEATRKGLTGDQFTEKTATMWQKDSPPGDSPPNSSEVSRCGRHGDLHSGDNAGLPPDCPPQFRSPPEQIRNDGEARFLNPGVHTVYSGLLTAGIGKSGRSQEHILIANILTTRWLAGEIT
ncbi:MAG: hypothetical protein R3C11_16750 [Planctomycetaceae bacterium]